MPNAAATIKTGAWDEKTLHELEDEVKVTLVNVEKVYTGDLVADGVVEYLMSYSSDGTVAFVGYEKVAGTLDGRSGAFVFEHRGTFANSFVKSVWEVVPASGTGDLAGISGRVTFNFGHQDEYPIVFEYEL